MTTTPVAISQLPTHLRFTASLTKYPLIKDAASVVRFRAQPVVRWLLGRAESGVKTDMNDICLAGFEQEDLMEFYRLIGYSIAGFEEVFCEELDKLEKAARRAARKKKKGGV